ncbi:TolC family protein [Leadbetterella sp. DM7]|uniref:TolC family protein n=1 Tax=Leadbetterella sp. DM7 TaxID=3235085 RepID=UPI00349EEE53
MKSILVTLLFTTLTTAAFAQNAQLGDTLYLDNAVEVALGNNYGIRVAQRQVDLANNRIFKGNAGMTPILDWNTSVNSTFNQVQQNFIDGRVINRFGTSASPNTALALQYTLYNGGRMNAAFDRLKSLGQLSEIQRQLVLQNTVSSVMEAYYNIQRLQSTLAFIDQIIRYYEERQTLTEERWQIGRGSKLDFLQSKADLTIQLTDQTNLEIQLRNAKIELNRLLARDPNIDFKVEGESQDYQMFDLQYLKAQAKSQNPEFLALKKQEEINQLEQREARAYLKPTINLNSSFGYNFNYNNAGLISNSQSTGLSAGLSASWRIFDGKLIKKNIEMAKINGDILRIRREELISNLDNEITAAYHQYETQKRLLELEQQNIATAQENLEISAEKFKLGASTILEINDAQTRFNTIMNRLVAAEYNLRISKLNLLTLSGELIR